jgi:hypothetical protein
MRPLSIWPGSDSVLVLLGAGASAGTANLRQTWKLTQDLRNWADIRVPPIPHSGRPAPPLAVLYPDASDPRPNLFEFIYQTMAASYKDPNRINFEHLIHAAESLNSFLPNPSPADWTDFNRPHLENFLQLRPLFDHWNYHFLLGTAALAACNMILAIFKSECDALPHPRDLALNRALRHLRENIFLRLFSLNYDDVPHHAGVSFMTGFPKDSGEFAPPHRWPWHRDILCQLHGSVRFAHGPFGVHYFSDRERALQGRAHIVQGPSKTMDGHSFPTTPMITGLRKADKALHDPFAEYLALFARELERVPKWLIVGYSFGDDHINALMKRAWAKWRRLAPGAARAVVVDYYKFEYLDERGTEPADMTPLGEKIADSPGRVFDEALQFVHGAKSYAYVRPMTLTKCGDVALTFDGVDDAMSTLLPEIERFLMLPSNPFRRRARETALPFL